MAMIPDAVTAALNELRFVVPLPILEKVFIKRHERWRAKHQSLNERIMDEVIRPRVLQDCNIAYGHMCYVDLSQCPQEEIHPHVVVYRIPKELTQGRSILSALQVVHGTPGHGGLMGGWANTSSSAVSVGANALAQNHEVMPVTSSASVVLIGENTVMVRDGMRFGGNAFLRCILENDERMTHLHYKVIPIFKELVNYAVKSYIYNTYIVEMDMAELAGGQELGAFKEIITEYRDAEELYQTTLREKYARAAVSTDYEMMRRYIKLQIGGFR